ncbi:sugar ABC transporter ATP-binding protein [Lapillicoccus jejuensis]|uniref:Monosaccharide ABC transporter ATP-binding protein (CUT2 family) n=1 Tax=Lapillicoccus jejuensis TaxID=402171 RepID=A0A542DXY0_9MICO|nr:sugar ABC transporter ATP-binding protein [Lapillicoccus jejuensis]TQJ07938.1 monosaccharide ABC transporter ATP-binding protein (CUT2 family) [Lapillicoccus jejuensis]
MAAPPTVTTTPGTTPTTTPTLAVRHLGKSFAGVAALEDVSLDLMPGSVHALVGENGAGKSTLIKLMTGVYTADTGTVRHRGEETAYSSPRSAQQDGIATIYQEVHLAPQLSVARNFFLGNELTRWGRLDLARMATESAAVLGRLGITVDTRRRLGEFSLGVQQMVAVARAVSADADVVIMDEPTSSLEPKEVDSLLQAVRVLKDDGVAVVYVSHKLDEVFAVCDTITVLRDGHLVWTGETASTNRRELVSRMLGRDASELTDGRLTRLSGRAPVVDAPPVLEATHLSRRLVLDDVSVVVRPGEVVGLAGLLGSGRSETVKTIFGALPLDSGEVKVDGRPLTRQSPASRLRRKVALLPEDRKAEGIIPDLSIRDNIGLAALPHITRAGFVDDRRLDEIVEVFMRRLRIKASGPQQVVSELSGGNQQKVLLARLLCLEPKVLLLDEPTRGIDVGAKAEVQELIAELAAKGMAVVLISSELEEVVEGSDSVVVLRDGAQLGTLVGADISEDAIMDLIAGAAEQEQAAAAEPAAGPTDHAREAAS